MSEVRNLKLEIRGSRPEIIKAEARSYSHPGAPGRSECSFIQIFHRPKAPHGAKKAAGSARYG